MSFFSRNKISEKLLCPICDSEVKEYPPIKMNKGNFICLKCDENINFTKMKDGKFYSSEEHHF